MTKRKLTLTIMVVAMYITTMAQQLIIRADDIGINKICCL